MSPQKSKSSPIDPEVLGFFSDREEPVKISRIEAQKRVKDRFSLFAGGRFLIGLSSETLLKSGLRRGDGITVEQIRRLIEMEQKEQIRTYLLRLLSKRDHSRFELQQKAQKIFGFHSQESAWIGEIIEELSVKGYVNEESFARKFILDKTKISSWGPAKIRNALIQKQLRSSLVDSLLDELILEDHNLTSAQALLLKKKWYFDKTSDRIKKKHKMHSFLAQRGFSFSVIEQAISLIFNNQDVSKPDT